ncbi:MAG: hypothetical protein U0350_47540 [Caldilineaceae bacterium]
MNQNSTTPFVKPVAAPRLAVRTNLRAGLAWGDLDEQAKALYDKITGAVSNIANAVPNSATDSTSNSTPA